MNTLFRGSSSIVAPLDPEDLGKGFAMASDEDQAKMLNKAGSIMYMACDGPLGMEKQLCFIADKLDNAGWRFVKELAAFYELKQEAKKPL